MSSGFFPLAPDDIDGKKLFEALSLLREVESSMREAIAINCVPEDAMIDGEYLGDLRRAIDLVAPALTGHAASPSMRDAALLFRTPDEFEALLTGIEASPGPTMRERLDDGLKAVAKATGGSNA